MPTYRVPIEIRWPESGSPGVNVWHARSGLTDDGIDAMVGVLHTFYNTLASTGVGGTAIVAGATVYSLGVITDVDTQEEKSSGNFPDITAAGGTNFLPPSNQICVTWRTSLRARRGTGRTFLGPLATNALEANGTPAAAALDLVRGAAATLVDSSMTDANGALGVYGRDVQGGGARVLRDFTGYSVSDQFAILRSRRD